MATLAQTLLARGFAALARVHAGTWSFGVVEFPAIAGALRPDDPRLSGASDRWFELQVDSLEMPATYPRQGDTLEHAGTDYTVIRVDDDPIRQITTILVSA
jgi:hypothetical protein